jgi:predicted HAD superfamily Cof-like phosphohydrolase
MEKAILSVRAFQTAFGAPMPEKPTMLDEERAKLRQKLLQEEVTELKKAEDLEEVADALCDILYIVFGTSHEYGLADRLSLMFDEVHKSNMAKMGEDGKPLYHKNGKVKKPEGWTPPNLKPILSRKFHLYNSDNATFADDLRAINEAEAKRWDDFVESEIIKRLNWWDKLKAKLATFLESGIKKNVAVQSGVDEAYRNKVTITAYGEESVLIDY